MKNSPISIFDTAKDLQVQFFLKSFTGNNWLSEQPQQKRKTISGKTLKNKLAKINLKVSKQLDLLISNTTRFFITDESVYHITYQQADNWNNKLTIMNTNPNFSKKSVQSFNNASEVVKGIFS
jgi:hypothetical protein